MKTPDLTAKEEDCVRAALRFLRARCGGWKPVAKALCTPERTITKAVGGETVSPRLTFRVARFAKVGVDDVLAGRFPPPGTCPHCGHVDRVP